jgi:diadenosine tetraphosphatase ApaH/serine/threonine PP2A family protein phosphatase
VALTGLRLALFADVHANREALAACLAHARRQGYDRAVFLGDLVGYCADPSWVLDEIVRLVGEGAAAVLGNHDDAVVRGPQPTMQPDAAEAVRWTRARLDPGHLAFLAGLPPTIEDGELLLVHANAWAPRRWEYVVSAEGAERGLAATDRRVTFFGHVHEPALYHLGAAGRVGAFTPGPGIAIPLVARQRWVVNPGSVGQPRDGIPSASYAVYDGRRRLLEYHRVPFDADATARKISAAGLPKRFGARLAAGV